MAHACGAFGQRPREMAPAGALDDLVCFTCGSRIEPLIVVGNDGADEEEESLAIVTPPPAPAPPPPPPPPRRQPPVAKQVRRLTPKPGLTHFKAVRHLVRVEMLARVPGMNRARARAVVERLPNRTMSAIISLPTGELAATPVGTGGTSLGPDLAQALKRVLS